MKHTKILSILALAFGLVSHGHAYTGGAVSNAGSITGVVSKKDAPPDPTKPVTKNNTHCGDSVPAEQHVVQNGKVKWAVAMLDGISAGKPLDEKADVMLDNKKCRFDPHVLVAPMGAELTVRNSDPMLHNSHFYLMEGNAKKNVINLALPTQGQSIKKGKILRKAGLLSVVCDAHEFMQAYVWVLDNPYGAVSDDNGAFELKDVPAGTHKMKVWHEAFGVKTVDVTVKAGETTSVKVDY